MASEFSPRLLFRPSSRPSVSHELASSHPSQVLRCKHVDHAVGGLVCPRLPGPHHRPCPGHLAERTWLVTRYGIWWYELQPWRNNPCPQQLSETGAGRQGSTRPLLPKQVCRCNSQTWPPKTSSLLLACQVLRDGGLHRIELRGDVLVNAELATSDDDCRKSALGCRITALLYSFSTPISPIICEEPPGLGKFWAGLWFWVSDLGALGLP